MAEVVNVGKLRKLLSIFPDEADVCLQHGDFNKGTNDFGAGIWEAVVDHCNCDNDE